MQFTIYGAGAIGGSLGAYMVRAGEEVIFVDRVVEHVQEINAHGLRLDGIRGEFVAKARAVTPQHLQKGLEVVLLAVKSQDTEEAVRQFMPFLKDDSMVVSLQNGQNEEKIAKMIGKERTIGAFINWGANYIAPGHIRFGVDGSFYLGELDGTISPRIEKLQRTFSFFLPVQVTSNIFGYLWSKQVYASLLFATALADLPVYEVVALPTVPALLRNLVCEAMQVPTALKISLEPFDEFDPQLFQNKRDEEAMEKIATHFRGKPINKTGIWRDIAVRKRKTEVEEIIGATVKQGKELGLYLPLNCRLIALIHELEDGKRFMTVENFKALVT